MHANRRTLTYSSLVVAMAVVLSVALLQLTQTTAKSAAPAAPLADIEFVPLVITKTVEVGPADSPWTFEVESSSYFTTVTIAAGGGFSTVMVPMGSLYTVTEIMQDNYWIKDRWCVYSDDGQEWINTDGDMNSIVDVQVGYGYAACEFVNSELATLTVVKDAIPDSTQPFTFSVSMYPTDNTDSTAQIEVNQLDVQAAVNGYGSLFQLIDDGTGVSNTKTLTDGMAGYTYKIRETFPEDYPEGWLPLGTECVDETGAVIWPPILNGKEQVIQRVLPIFGNFAEVEIQAGGQYTCTFTNGAPAIELTKTVGTVPNVCAATDEISVFPGTEVNYCYEVMNTGGLTLTLHTLVDDKQGDLLTDFLYDLGPGDSVNTVQAGLTVSDVLEVTTMNVATWTAQMTYSLILAAGAADISASVATDETQLPNGMYTLTAVATDTAKVNVIEPGKIIVKKETLPADSAQAFSFTIDSLVALEFSLKDGEVYTSPDLWPGVYRVTEAQVDGWLPPVASCENDAGQTNIPPDDIDLGPGQTVTCVFTNTQAGTIIVEKQTDPDGATGSFTFSGDAAGSIADGGQIVVNGLQPGAYTSQETVPTSWELTGITCDDANSSGDVNTATATFQLEAGETVKCTFNNLQLVPSLSVLKTVGEDANTCATTQELEVDAGTDVYFCFTLGNTGNVTLTEHILVDASLDVTVTFNYPLAPGDELQVTNKWLADNGKQTVLGPVTATEDFVNTVVYSSPVGEVILEDRSSAEVVLPPTGLDDDELPARERIYLPQVGGQ